MKQENSAITLFFTKAEWEGQAMPRSSQAKSGTNETCPQRPYCNDIFPKLMYAKYLTVTGYVLATKT